MTSLPFSAAADRNKQPILNVLLRVLPTRGAALEIASGTGQHACCFAAAFTQWTWQPSEGDASSLAAIDAAVVQSHLHNLRPAIYLDVMAANWAARSGEFNTPFDAIYCANLIHIAPWATCAALMRGAAQHLAVDGVLLTYGPYLEDGVPTSPGNLAFDCSLRERDAAWGIRDLAAVNAEASHAGLHLRARHAMPANNLLLEWVREVRQVGP